MTRLDLYHLMDAFDTCLAELEELERSEGWFSSDCYDVIDSALEIIQRELNALD